MLWFIADTHFGHANILHYAKRPFISINECDAHILQQINRIVKLEDTLIIVGDFCLGNTSAWRYYRSQIRCKHIILVRGNHDNHIPKNDFVMVVDYMEFRIAKQKVLVKHYPYRIPWWIHIKNRLLHRLEARYVERRPIDRGDWLIHGHTHSETLLRNKSICVCVEALRFKPISLEQLEQIIQRTTNGSRSY